jgi:hypothetical protein
LINSILKFVKHCARRKDVSVPANPTPNKPVEKAGQNSSFGDEWQVPAVTSGRRATNINKVEIFFRGLSDSADSTIFVGANTGKKCLWTRVSQPIQSLSITQLVGAAAGTRLIGHGFGGDIRRQR